MASFFNGQRQRVTSQMRADLPAAKAARMKAAPTWWDPQFEDKALEDTMRSVYANVGRGALQTVADDLGRIVFRGATQSILNDLLTYGGERIVDINARTLQALTVELAEGTRRGYSIPQLIDGVPEEGYRGVLQAGLDNGVPVWDELRAETIARTETMLSYNRATVTGYSEFGVTHLLAYDGDDDAECAERNGQEFTVEEALAIEDHPNGTLVWSPVVEDRPAQASEPEPVATATPPTRITNADVARAREAFNTRIRQQELDDIARNRARNDAATVSKPGPDVSLIAGQPSKPVSSAFDDIMAKVQSHPLAMKDPQYRKVVDKIQSALGTIDKTFKDGNLPPMPHIGPIKGGNGALQGQYKHNLFGTRTPVSLEFRANAHLETVFHEISHFIDHHGLGNGTTFMSKLGFAQARGKLDELTASLRTNLGFARTSNNLAEIARLERELAEMQARAEVFAPVAQAIMDSRGYRELVEALATGRVNYRNADGLVNALSLNPSTRKWITYARAPEESFARAMGQYLSRKNGQAAVREIEEALYYPGTRVVRPLADQWEWDDFDKIERAIDDMFRKLGWLVN